MMFKEHTRNNFDLALLKSTVSKGSLTPPTFLPLTARGGSVMKQRLGGPHPYVASSHCILPPLSKHLPPTIFPTHHDHPEMSHPKTTLCKFHVMTLSACPIHLTITDHIFSFIPQSPFFTSTRYTRQMSFTLPSHALKNPLTIYYWPPTRCSPNLSFFAQWTLVH
jgi:hypothetical protein